MIWCASTIRETHCPISPATILTLEVAVLAVVAKVFLSNVKANQKPALQPAGTNPTTV